MRCNLFAYFAIIYSFPIFGIGEINTQLNKEDEAPVEKSNFDALFNDMGQQDELSMDIVTNWAKTIGTDLWTMGRDITQLDNIKTRYKQLNASVLPTDGRSILKGVTGRMNNMIKRKIKAVLKIKEAAETAQTLIEESDSFSYYNAKYSKVVDNKMDFVEYDLDTNYINSSVYSNMTLEKNAHFYNIPVNTNYSAVHVPTNVFDQSKKVKYAIKWSEYLENTFKENYRDDPYLMWQYFGSVHGFLRYFPAFHWSLTPDVYDCRSRNWFMEAETLPKDVIILIDNSGSMFGMKNTISQLTADALLDTFNNNDFVNIYIYDEYMKSLVPCFNNTLVQATSENMKIMKMELYHLCPKNKMDYVRAFKAAYNVLHDFSRNNTEPAEERNQAIFLLTDILPAELSDIRKLYDNVYNDSLIAVELFIYFIGLDIPNVREIQWEKCLRNGSLVHVRTMDEVRDDAFKYMKILEKPHSSESIESISWTHIFVDIEKDKGALEMENLSPEELEVADPKGSIDFQTMVTLSVPVYSEMDAASSALLEKPTLIGVAGIDVPVAEFEKLTVPYKIGVNGYAFLIANNGFLISHPELRITQNRIVRENFDSVDLTEVEFADDDNDNPRESNDRILKLRQNMVNGEEGELYEIAIKFYYDHRMRVGSESRNYFYMPLKYTPYTLGLALPRGYGSYWIRTNNEIEKSLQEGEDYSKYFKGNWRIHPHWNYCDYVGSENTYHTAEEKIVHILSKIFSEAHNWTWIERYESQESTDDTIHTSHKADNIYDVKEDDRQSNSYFCDKELLELMFFDAKLTQFSYEYPVWNDITNRDKSGQIWKNSILTRFVATQGGLTRWQDMTSSINSNFGDANNKALNENWYKSAVLLHHLNSENFVFLPPSDSNLDTVDKHSGIFNQIITASHAVFYSQNGNEAPGVVVGYQFPYRMLYEKLLNVANHSMKTRCHLGALDCYIIDTNGYVVVSMEPANVGKFFGNVEGAIMDQLVSENIFRRITMFDYQAEHELHKIEHVVSAAPRFVSFNAFDHIIVTVNWMVSQLAWLLVEFYFWQSAHYVNAKGVNESLCQMEPVKYANKCQTRTIPQHINRNVKDKEPAKQPCDMKSELYLFQNLSAYGYVSKEPTNFINCSRPFYIEAIRYTNLLLVVVDPSYQTCFRKLTIDPVVITYNSTYPYSPACSKVKTNFYQRKRLHIRKNNRTKVRIQENCRNTADVATATGFSAFLYIITPLSVIVYYYYHCSIYTIY